MLRDLEKLDAIQLIPQESAPSQLLEPKLSEQFQGRISPELATASHRQPEEIRNEWEKDI
ncbi:hypothetical protein GCM10027341_08490 [Spirosoma knui]